MQSSLLNYIDIVKCDNGATLLHQQCHGQKYITDDAIENSIAQITNHQGRLASTRQTLSDDIITQLLLVPPDK